MNRALPILQAPDFALDEILQVVKALVYGIESLVYVIEACIYIAPEVAEAGVAEYNAEHYRETDQQGGPPGGQGSIHASDYTPILTNALVRLDETGLADLPPNFAF